MQANGRRGTTDKKCTADTQQEREVGTGAFADCMLRACARVRACVFVAFVFFLQQVVYTDTTGPWVSTGITFRAKELPVSSSHTWCTLDHVPSDKWWAKWGHRWDWPCQDTVKNHLENEKMKMENGNENE